MDSLKEGWYRIPKTVRKPLIFIVGFAVIVVGIVMLIFPGPGWAAIFLGFAILATEFAFAEKVRDWLIAFLKDLIRFALQEFRKPWRLPY